MSLSSLLQLVVSAAALALGVGVGLYSAGPSLAVSALTPVAVRAEPLPLDGRAPGRDRVDRFRFLGALRLSADQKEFGGLSGLLWEPACQRLLGVTDSGNWLILEPQETDGRLSGIGAAWMAPILDEEGRPARRKRTADAEALVRDPATGDILVWFEGDHRGQSYRDLSACRPESLDRPALAVLRPEAIRSWPLNGGVEAAVATPGGFLLFSEEEPAGPGRRRVVELPDGETSYPAPDGFAAADAADAGPGEAGGEGLFLLLRRFSPERGSAARVVSLAPGPSGFEATELAALAPPLLVDNMEALAIRREGDRFFLYLASDDNFNPMQQTLLIKFALER